jgi:hypothetical protein
LTDSLSVGDVIHGVQGNNGQVNRDVMMVNNLLTVPIGTTSTTVPGDVGDIYMRSANNFGPLPTAVATGALNASGIADGSTYLSITLSSSFAYLVAAYDGPNGGIQVWSIGGLASGTTIDIPRYAEPSGANADGPLVQSQRYLMTGWSLLNPGTPNNSPDGGTTALMLTTALGALGVLKRRLK